MKSITKTKAIIFCLILVSLTASGSYAYFTWGEPYVGQFKDAAGDIISDKGSGSILTDFYINYQAIVDDKSENLTAGTVSLNVQMGTNTEFSNISLIYKVNNGEWSTVQTLTNASPNYTWSYAHAGGTIKFRLIATRIVDSKSVMTNDIFIKNAAVTMTYDGTNSYFGCDDFTYTGAVIE